MTTRHPRRTQSQQAADILTALEKRQAAIVAQCKANYEQAQEALAKTRKALEALIPMPLPGLEPEIPGGAGPSTPPAQVSARTPVQITEATGGSYTVRAQHIPLLRFRH